MPIVLPNAAAEFLLPAGTKFAIVSESVARVEQEYNNVSFPQNYTDLATVGRSVRLLPEVVFGNDRLIRVTADEFGRAEYALSTDRLSIVPPVTHNDIVPARFVAAAATFVTLTLDSNSGDLRLTSAGAHGLTAAVAVGAAIYITFSGGTGVSGLYTVKSLDADTTGVAVTVDFPFASGLGTAVVTVAGGAAVPVKSYVVPANSLGNGGYIDVDLTTSYTSSSNARTISINLGATQVAAIAAVNSGISGRIQKRIYRVGAAVQVTAGVLVNGAETANSVLVSPTIDLTAATTLSVLAAAANANQRVNVDAAVVEIKY